MYIITGSIQGLVTVRSLTTGAKLKELNVIKEQLEEQPLTQLKASEKVNRIRRYGKWVFSAHQNNLLNAFNIHQVNEIIGAFLTIVLKTEARVAEHSYNADGPVKSFELDAEQTTLYLHVETDTGKLQVVVWSPKWEEFGGIDSSRKWKHKVTADQIWIYMLGTNIEAGEEAVTKRIRRVEAVFEVVRRRL